MKAGKTASDISEDANFQQSGVALKSERSTPSEVELSDDDLDTVSGGWNDWDAVSQQSSDTVEWTWA